MEYNLGQKIWQGTWLILPLYPYFNDETKQVYPVNIFKSMRDSNWTFQQLKDFLFEFVEFRNKLLGSHYANQEVYLMRENRRFAFYFSSVNDTFKLWDDYSRFLGEFKINSKDIPSVEFIKWIEKVTDDYLRGVVKCSDCKKTILENEIAGRYFAGIYCEDCWNSKWKKIEEKETYD